MNKAICDPDGALLRIVGSVHRSRGSGFSINAVVHPNPMLAMHRFSLVDEDFKNHIVFDVSAVDLRSDMESVAEKVNRRRLVLLAARHDTGRGD